MVTTLEKKPTNTTAADPCFTAFISPGGPEVFGSVVHMSHIWHPDAYDVESIHTEARQQYLQLLHRAASVECPPCGKSLLLIGEAGAGKTHLMRAIRAKTHADRLGYCGYLQLSTRNSNYTRYVLSNVITSLEQPYHLSSSETGLQRLAKGLLESLDPIPLDERQQLVNELLEPAEVAKLVHRFADVAVQMPQFQGLDINMIRALLFTLANDSRIRQRILPWLRCEDLNKLDREMIGDLVPRVTDEKPMQTLVEFGKLMHAVHQNALVIMADQLDEAFQFDQELEAEGHHFRAAVAALLEIADKIPNAIVVLGCLRDVYKTGMKYLQGWMTDRLLRDPEPCELNAQLNLQQIQEVLTVRLQHFYEELELDQLLTNPIYPYTPKELEWLVGKTIREVLVSFSRHRQECIKQEKLVPFGPTIIVPPPPPPPPPLEKLWNDFQSSYKAAVLDDEAGLAELLSVSIRQVSQEMPKGIHFSTDPNKSRFLPVEIHAGNAVEKLLVAICEKAAQGVGLKNQIVEVANKAGEIPAVFVRSTDFPSSPTAKVTQELVKHIAPKGKGRKVTVANSDWRTMAAFKAFAETHGKTPGFVEWQRDEKPLSELPALLRILALDKLPKVVVEPDPGPDNPPPAKPTSAKVEPVKPEPQPLPEGVIRVGTSRGAIVNNIDFQPLEFCRHAAFLGSSGSGKTTAALTIVEQLLAQGIPAILIDKKGDLARYADPEAWLEPGENPAQTIRKKALRDRLDIQLYTPGNDQGRHLAIPVGPSGLAGASSSERDQLCEHAAASLAKMLGFNGKTIDPKQVILQQAIGLLATQSSEQITVPAIRELVQSMDDALVALCSYEEKHFSKLAENLLTFSLAQQRLIEGDEVVNIARLAGKDGSVPAAKTRLSIINTQFIGDDGKVDFWLSQFLIALYRWGSKNPSKQLQLVVMLDEAEKYLPPSEKPATKPPLENLLMRARAMGIGLFLLTQSPGNFDYKCRDQVNNWFIGKIKEKTALSKVEPMLSGGSGDPCEQLPKQSIGEFYLARENQVKPIRVQRSLINTEPVSQDKTLRLARKG